MKLFDMLRHAWDPGQSKPADDPATRAAINRAARVDDLAASLLHSSERAVQPLQAPPAVQEDLPPTPENVYKELKAIVDKRVRDIWTLYGALSLRAGYYQTADADMVATVIHTTNDLEMLLRPPLSQMDFPNRPSPTFSAITRILSNETVPEEVDRFDQLRATLVHIANEAGGDPKAFRSLTDAQRLIDQLQEVMGYLREQNLRVLTNLTYAEPDKINFYRFEPV